MSTPKPSTVDIDRAVDRHREAVEVVGSIESTIGALRVDRETLVASGLEDDVTADKLVKLDSKIALAESRLGKARITVAEIEERAHEVCIRGVEDRVRWVNAQLELLERRFRESLYAFFEGGTQSQFFAGSANVGPRQARILVWFSESDAFKRAKQVQSQIGWAIQPAMPLSTRLRAIREFDTWSGSQD